MQIKSKIKHYKLQSNSLLNLLTSSFRFKFLSTFFILKKMDFYGYGKIINLLLKLRDVCTIYFRIYSILLVDLI